MTNEELDALVARGRAALEGVTAGPWSHEWEIDGPKTHTRIKAGASVCTTSQQCGRPHHRSEQVKNAAFIASARDLVPELMDALTALRTERDELRAAIFGSGDYCKTLRNGNFVEMAQATEAGRKGAIARAETAEARVAELETDMGKVILNLPPAEGIRAAGPVEGVKMLRKAYETVSRRALAAEAAALERAVEAVHHECWTDGDGGPATDVLLAEQATTTLAINAIRALITPEGRTVLDAALADARKAGKLEGLREAAAIPAAYAKSDYSEECNVMAEAIVDEITTMAARVEGGDA